MALSIEEKQVKRLERQWELLEGIKRYRVQVPVLFVTVILTITAFTLSNKTTVQPGPFIPFTCVVIALLGGFGLFTHRTVRKHYDYSCDKLDYLYRKLGMTGGEFEPEPIPVLERAGHIFLMGYIMIIAASAFSLAAVLLLPPS